MDWNTRSTRSNSHTHTIHAHTYIHTYIIIIIIIIFSTIWTHGAASFWEANSSSACFLLDAILGQKNLVQVKGPLSVIFGSTLIFYGEAIWPNPQTGGVPLVHSLQLSGRVFRSLCNIRMDLFGVAEFITRFTKNCLHLINDCSQRRLQQQILENGAVFPAGIPH